MIYKTIMIFIFSLIIFFGKNVSAVNCEDIRPMIADDDVQFEGNISGKVDGLFKKLIGVEADVNGKYRRIREALSGSVPSSDKVKMLMWERILYLQCQVIDESGLNGREKITEFGKLFSLVGQPPPDIIDEVKKLPRPVTIKDIEITDRVQKLAEVKPGDEIRLQGHFSCGFILEFVDDTGMLNYQRITWTDRLDHEKEPVDFLAPNKKGNGPMFITIKRLTKRSGCHGTMRIISTGI